MLEGEIVKAERCYDRSQSVKFIDNLICLLASSIFGESVELSQYLQVIYLMLKAYQMDGAIYYIQILHGPVLKENISYHVMAKMISRNTC
jgi:hypothetical protein